MLDINLIRTTPEVVEKALKDRQKDVTLLNDVIKADGDYRTKLVAFETIKAEQNKLNKSIQGKRINNQDMQVCPSLQIRLRTQVQNRT